MTEKEKRDLDGFYLRVKRGNKYENLCFTDLTAEEQKKWLARLSAEGLRSMVNVFCGNIKMLANLNMDEEELRFMTIETANLLRKFGDAFNVKSKWESDTE